MADSLNLYLAKEAVVTGVKGEYGSLIVRTLNYRDKKWGIRGVRNYEAVCEMINETAIIERREFDEAVSRLKNGM